MEDSRSVKYAGELVSIKRPNQTLSITDCLHPITEADDEPFIGVINKKSIFFLSILKVKEKVAASANIPIDDYFDIVDNTKFANKMIFDAKNGLGAAAPKAETKVAKMHTPIKMGKFKGKSPYQLLVSAEDPESMAEELRSHADFLKTNVEKYPANQEGIDAINEAIKLYEDGELTSETAEPLQQASGGILEIYAPPTKYWAKRKDDKGNTKCFQLSITCNPTNKYPYHIDCTNFYCPIGQNSNGTTPIYVDKMDKDSKVSVSIDLSKAEWNMVIGKLSYDLSDAHSLWYPEMRTQDDIARHSYSS